MKTLFNKLYKYQHHYNQLNFALCKENLPQINHEILDILNHSVAAHFLWNNRILNEENIPENLWKLDALSDIIKMENEQYDKSLAIIERFPIQKEIHFIDTEGKAHQRSLEQILFHVSNHYTYHRGQLILAFRKVGLKPIASDYILWKPELI